MSVFQSQRHMIAMAQAITSMLAVAATNPPAFGQAVTTLIDACHSAAVSHAAAAAVVQPCQDERARQEAEKEPGTTRTPRVV